MIDKARITAAARLCAQGLPAVAATAITAIIAPVGGLAAAFFAALVSAWAAALRRQSTLFPAPTSFKGS